MIPTIKRKDSVSSILMFIFNIFLSAQNITSVPLKKIFPILSPFAKSETAIRMGLSRAVQNGLLSNRRHNGEVYYDLTASGQQALEEWRETLTAYHNNIDRQLADWNGQWTIIISNNYSTGHDEWLAQSGGLARNHYGHWGKNIWLSPYPVNFILRDTPSPLLIMEAHPVQTLSNQELAAMVWPVTDLADQYQIYLQTLEQAAADLLADLPTAFTALPFLHTYGSQLFSLIQQDSQLPIEVLPENWGGIKAYQTFQSIRQKVLPVASEYISNILAD